MKAAGSTPLSPSGRAAPARIDPRIRARRIEVQRVEGRRRLQRLVDLGLVLTVAAAFVGALWTPLLDVDEIRVTGADRTGAATVLEEAGILTGDPLVSVDLAAAGRRVRALPWVGEVRLHRGVDGVVRITVEERSPVAWLATGGGPVLVDREGRVLGADPVATGQLELSGVDRVPEIGGFLPAPYRVALRLAARLDEVVPGAVVSLAADPLVGRLAQGGEVHFGDGGLLDAKVQSLQTVLEQVDLTCLAVLDLRLPGSPVLTREQRCS